LCAAVALLFSGRYPRGIFDLLLGLNRWVLRVTAYASLMTDVYPPFRLDTGGADDPAPSLPGPAGPGTGAQAAPPSPYGASPLTTPPSGPAGPSTTAPGTAVPTTTTAPGTAVSTTTGTAVAPGTAIASGMPATPRDADQAAPFAVPREDVRLATTPPGAPRARHDWRAGPIVAVVFGAVLVAGSLAAGIGGGAMAIADHQRDSDGFVSASTVRLSTTTYAVTTQEIQIHGPGRGMTRSFLGEVRVAVDGGSAATFTGIARRADVDAYLGTVAHDQVTGLSFPQGQGVARYVRVPGGAPAAAPGTQPFWVASAAGTGARSLIWEVQDGDWVLVVMNADASTGVEADVTLAGTVPGWSWIPTALWVGAAILFAIGAGLIGLGVAFASRRPPGGPGQYGRYGNDSPDGQGTPDGPDGKGAQDSGRPPAYA
jgi:hypothetical protein